MLVYSDPYPERMTCSVFGELKTLARCVLQG